MAMMKCPECGSEISDKASACPKCGAKIKKKHKVLGITLLVIGILIIIGAIGSIGGEPKKVEEPAKVEETKEVSVSVEKAAEETVTEPVNEEPKQTTFGVGEKVELNDVVVTLVGVTESNGSQFVSPADGNVFVLCEFEIENNTSGDVAVSSMLSFETYCDDYATNFSLTALMEKGNKNQLDGTVAAGKKFNGVVGYEIPADWKELEIKFTPNFWSGRDITFVANH